MSADIGKGDLVECVRSRDSRGVSIRAGETYCVLAVVEGPGRCPTCGNEGDSVSAVQLRGQTYPTNFFGGQTGWCACHFRPISRRSDFERLLTQLKQPLPDESAEPRERAPQTA